MKRRGCPTQRRSHAHVCAFSVWVALFLAVLTATPTLSAPAGRHGSADKAAERFRDACSPSVRQAPAQDTNLQTRGKARIDKEALRTRVQGGESVHRAIIQGDDLIAILSEMALRPTATITITDSVIEGGLDFTALPARALEQVEGPKFWTDRDRELWIARNRSVRIEKARVVANPITIAGSLIRPGPPQGYSAGAVAINARGVSFQAMSFGGTIFNGAVDFSGAIFSGAAYFGSATFNGRATFGISTFGGEANFTGGATFSERADFSGATFNREAAFLTTIFNGEASFGIAAFKEEATFQHTTFGERATFEGATFSGRANFGQATFCGAAVFQDATFNGEAVFGRVAFYGEAGFRRTTFSGEANFWGTTFDGETTFRSARFAMLAFFKEARFVRRLTLDIARFDTYADFRDTQIRALAFNNAISPQVIQGRMDFRRAVITEAHLQDLVFEKDVDFSDTRFGVAADAEQAPQQASQAGGPSGSLARQTKCPSASPEVRNVATVFRFVTCEGHAYFLRTAFCGRTNLERVTFHKDANFTDALFFRGHRALPVFSLSYVNFATLRLRWSQLPPPASWVQNAHTEETIHSFLERKDQAHAQKNQETIEARGEPLQPLSEVFKHLEANFRRQNELEDANEAYYQMKRAKLREAREGQGLWQRLSLEGLWLLGKPSRYGTGLWTVVLWSLGLDLIFCRHLLEDRRPPEAAQCGIHTRFRL
jgi:uncharacterized protein YjbI with pentapeptide repeats